MGVTINFRGKLADRHKINEFCKEIIAIAELLSWDYSILDKASVKKSEATIGIGDRMVSFEKGVSLRLHSKCESLDFYFTSDGSLISPMDLIMQGNHKGNENFWLFVKTQFAPPEIHITIIRLLKYLKEKYIPNLEVHDEGDYWETESHSRLKKKMNFISRKIDLLEQALAEGPIPDPSKLSPEEMLVKVEQILRKIGKKEVSPWYTKNINLN